MDNIGRFLIGVLLSGVAGDDGWFLASGNFTAVLHSCVQIPCECTFPGNLDPAGEAKIWFKGHDNWDSVVADSKLSRKIHSNFTHRASVSNITNLRNCTLLIKNVTHSDAGKYLFRLEVNNENSGKFTYRNSPFYISVSDVPSDPVLQGPARIVEGFNTSLICRANSNCPLDPPSLSWAGLNHAIAINHSGRYSSMLTFKPSYQDHGKVVQCLVQYKHIKNPRTGNITLAVEYPPRDTRVVFLKDGNGTETTGDVPLTCVSDSNPKPHNYSWIRQDGESGVPLEWHSKTITVSRDSGKYRCVAFNAIGSDQSPPKSPLENTTNIVLWVAVPIISVLCVSLGLGLIFWIRFRRHEQSGTPDSPDITITIPQLTRGQQKSRNVYIRHEDFYANMEDISNIYANCADEAAHPGKGWPRCSVRSEELYANVSDQAKRWPCDRLDIY